MRNINYKKLRFYILSKEITILIYKITKEFPKDEQGYTGIVNQLKRASISSISNIAEGSSRKDKELLHFLTLSLGSLREIDTQLDLSYELDFIKVDEYEIIKEKIDEAISKLCMFMKKINYQIKKIENEYKYKNE